VGTLLIMNAWKKIFYKEDFTVNKMEIEYLKDIKFWWKNNIKIKKKNNSKLANSLIQKNYKLI
jgi:hypothetical protein